MSASNIGSQQMKQVSYWHDTAPVFTGAEQGSLPAQADAVVIGGGFTGLSAALALARRGASVVVLEANKVISGASALWCMNRLAAASVNRAGD